MNFIFIVKIGRPSKVSGRFFFSLGSNTPFEVVLCCFVDVMFDYGLFICFRWQ